MNNLDEAILRDIYERLEKLENPAQRVMLQSDTLDGKPILGSAGKPSEAHVYNPAQVRSIVSEARKKRERVKELESQVANISKAHAADVEKLQNRITQLRWEVRNPPADIPGIAARTIKELESDISRLKARLEERAQACNEFSDTQAMLEKVCQERNDFEQQVATATKTIFEAREENAQLRNELVDTRRVCRLSIEKNRVGEQARREPLLREISALSAKSAKKDRALASALHALLSRMDVEACCLRHDIREALK